MTFLQGCPCEFSLFNPHPHPPVSNSWRLWSPLISLAPSLTTSPMPASRSGVLFCLLALHLDIPVHPSVLPPFEDAPSPAEVFLVSLPSLLLLWHLLYFIGTVYMSANIGRQELSDSFMLPAWGTEQVYAERTDPGTASIKSWRVLKSFWFREQHTEGRKANKRTPGMMQPRHCDNKPGDNCSRQPVGLWFLIQPFSVHLAQKMLSFGSNTAGTIIKTEGGAGL